MPACLPQHWLRDEPLTHWCCVWNRPVTRWHEHHGRAPITAYPIITKGLRNDLHEG